MKKPNNFSLCIVAALFSAVLVALLVKLRHPHHASPAYDRTIVQPAAYSNNVSGKQIIAVPDAVHVQTTGMRVTHEHIQDWITELDSTNGVKRSDAASELCRQGTNSVPALLQAVKQGEVRVRSKAIMLLGQIGDTNVCSELVDIYHSGIDLPGHDRAMLVSVLDELNGAAYVDLFKKELAAQEDLDTQFALAIALAKRNDKSGVKHILYRLETLDKRRQKVAAWYLEKLFKQDFDQNAKQWRQWLQQNGKI